MSEQNPPPQQPLFWRIIFSIGEAVRFLTLLPVPGMPPMSERSVIVAIPWFPAVGVIIATLLLPLGWIAGALWGDLVRAMLLVIGWGILTAGLHLDGVSDTFDAVMSWRPRERKLEIMKDSRIGAMGAMALVAVLMLKVGFLSAAGDRWWQALLLAPVVGRWVNLYGIFWFPAAREGGLGRVFHENVQRRDFFAATAGTIVWVSVIGGLHGIIAMLSALAVAHLLARWWERDLGGLTGDTYGALCEIGETVVLGAVSS